jgi:iron complex outermembrane recepter protein
MATLKPFFQPKSTIAPATARYLAILCVASPMWVQAQVNPVALSPVTVSGRASPPVPDISGWGDVPLNEAPFAASSIGKDQLQAIGARRLADVTKLDVSVSDAYNSPGYWDFVTVRGFVLDNRYNFRREGLPISAETSIPLDNKERIDILKGTSGIQAGTSAPGGLVNYGVKRPTDQNLREVRLEASANGSVLGAVDLGGRFGEGQAFGYRLNVANETLRPITKNLDGQRNLFALAMDWRFSPASVLSAEVESSHKTQPSQSGFSLLGNTLPAPVDPRLNLNNQPWSQPSDFDATTGTLRFEQSLNADWRWSAQLGSQELKTNDRLAYAFGCSAENNYDRYCSDGTYDLYDYRSENEQRIQQALDVKLSGKFDAFGTRHTLGLGLQTSLLRTRYQMQAYNYVGSGNVAGTAFVAPDPTLTSQNTNRDERSNELSVQDAIRWTDKFTTWLGLRATTLQRDSVRTNGSRPSSYNDTVNTPWLGASYAIASGQTVYASYGEGIESQVVPNRPAQYTNAGAALPALKSRQVELGLKGALTDINLNWQLALYKIVRPMTNLDDCANLGLSPCLGQNDGEAVHSGLEASAQWAQGPWRLGGGLTLINAVRQGGTVNPAANGQRPTNVPDYLLRLNSAWRVTGVPGLELQANVSTEGPRSVMADGSITLPAWSRVDAALRYDTKLAATQVSLTLGIDNLFDNRYWQESPSQYGHIYLFPGSARTARVGLTANF